MSVFNHLGRVVPGGAHGLAHGVACASAVVLAFVPLFNLVGYESAAFFGVMLGLFATGLTVYSVRSGAIASPLGRERTQGPARDFGKLALHHLALMAGPLLILTLNGIRVPNCDWASGFAFWAVIVAPAILLGQAAAWVATSVAGDRKIAPWVIAFGFPLADAAALAHHLAFEPPIVGHQWFLGYFGGSIYDEALGLPPSLLAYRVLHLVAIVCVVASIQGVFELRRGRWPGWTAFVALGAATVFFAGFSERARFGISIDRAHIVEELGGKVETEHFVIYYPKSRGYIERLDEIIDDHEFRYAQMREFFGTDPVAESGQPVTSFVYRDRDSKADLMGGRDTMVAKLWLHEMHILWRGPGDRMLAHELAHIFTEPFGAGPLRLSTQRRVGVNMGLVEGVAVAAEWPAGDLDPHEATAAMRRLEIAPDLRRILGAGGFWTEASGPAYTAMGSFVRYLVDEEGMEAFKEAYPRGDFAGVYGVEVAELIGRWEAHLDEMELSPRQMEVARDRYDRRSIFGRVCARAQAERLRRARQAASKGALAASLTHYEAFFDYEAKSPPIVREYAEVLRHMGREDEALAILAAVEREDLTNVERARFLEMEGDLRWSKSDEAGAGELYRRAIDKKVGVDRERRLRLKIRAVDAGDDRGRRVLVERISEEPRLYAMMMWLKESPDDPVARYLVGRSAWRSRLHDEAIEHLERVRGQLGADVLDAEVLRMLGQSYYFEGRFDDSHAIWKQLATSEMTPYREASSQWMMRVEWARGNRR